MKKSILLNLILIFTTNIYAQYNNQHKEYKNNAEYQEITNHQPNYLELSDQYSIVARKYQYGALGCAAASVGLFVGYGCMKDKFELKDGKTEMKENAKILIFGGSACAALAIICQVYSIECKFKADKYLRLQVSENGAGLAYVF